MVHPTSARLLAHSHTLHHRGLQTRWRTWSTMTMSHNFSLLDMLSTTTQLHRIELISPYSRGFTSDELLRFDLMPTSEDRPRIDSSASSWSQLLRIQPIPTPGDPAPTNRLPPIDFMSTLADQARPSSQWSSTSITHTNWVHLSRLSSIEFIFSSILNRVRLSWLLDRIHLTSLKWTPLTWVHLVRMPTLHWASLNSNS